jgi:hypothetical protein
LYVVEGGITLADRLTSEQRASVQAAILVGHELDEFAARHPDWPQEDLASFYTRLQERIRTTKLKKGQYWGVPSEWIMLM